MAELCVWNLPQIWLRSALSDLQSTALVGFFAQVNSQREHAVFSEIAVPRIEMPRAGHHSVNATGKAANRGTSGDAFNQSKEFLIIQKKIDQAFDRVIVDANFLSDALMAPWLPARLKNLGIQFFKKLRTD